MLPSTVPWLDGWVRPFSVRRLALRRVDILVLADLRAEDVSELGQLLTSGLPGNLLGDRLGGVQRGRVGAIVTRDAVSSTLVGATSLSLFIGNKHAKPLIAPNRLMTQ
jgi:hypothetical protein